MLVRSVSPIHGVGSPFASRLPSTLTSAPNTRIVRSVANDRSVANE